MAIVTAMPRCWHIKFGLLHLYSHPAACCCTSNEQPHLLRASPELQIYERVDMFRQQIGNLDLTVGIYNSVQRTMLNVEKPLVLQKIEAVDAALKKGLAVSAGP